jgi:hypothetical protein
VGVHGKAVHTIIAWTVVRDAKVGVGAVDVFIGGKPGPHATPGTKILEDVPCDALPGVLKRVIPCVSKKRRLAAKDAGQSITSNSQR